MKVYCKFCTKNVGGFCRAKKNTSIKENKSRYCTKYKEDKELKQQYDAYHEENKKGIPTFKPTFRYYEKIAGKKTEEGPLYVKVN